MPSPFPGMNPYLEQESVWHSFHEQFPAFCQEMLTAQVRPKYFVKLDVNVYIHELPEGSARVVRPDVTVGHPSTAGQAPTAGGPSLAAPVIGQLELAIDVLQEAFVEIHETRTGRVIAAIELLSPTNKAPGPERAIYLAKRRRYAQSNINLVEIDLLRGWPRMPVAGLPKCDYCVLVSRAAERPHVGLWPIKLREKLPTIPIPLLPEDAPAQLDLQALLERLYDAGGYEDYIYSGTPEPPLDPADQAWADEVIGRLTGR